MSDRKSKRRARPSSPERGAEGRASSFGHERTRWLHAARVVRVDDARAVECHLGIVLHRFWSDDGALYPNSDDFQIIQGVLRREARASDAFLERVRCVPRILEALNRASMRPLQSHDLDDLGQHVLVEMLAKLAEFPQDGIIDRWAYHFCVYSFFNRVRQHRRTATAKLESAPEPADASAPSLELLDIGLLYQALAELSPDDRTLFIEKALDGRTFDEIARRTRTSPNTLKSWYYAVLARLRAQLSPKFGHVVAPAPRTRQRATGAGEAS